jgi:hypothetical protein
MAAEAKMLTREEFASLLLVGNASAVSDPRAVIPAEHSARLIALGYMVDLAGRLRMTTPGRLRIRKQTNPPTSNEGALRDSHEKVRHQSAAELTPAGFDKHELHRLVALGRLRISLACDAHSGPGDRAFRVGCFERDDPT